MKTLLLTTMATLGITAASTAQNVPSYVPTDGLVGWWPFNGNANDESGNGNDGTVNGATLSSDRNGNSNSAYNFSQNPNYISLPEISTQLGAPSSSATYSMWFKGAPINSFSTVGVILSATISPFDYQIRFETTRDVGGTSGLRKKIYYRCPQENNEPTSQSNYDPNIWHNIIAVINSSNNTYSFYFDGFFDQTMSFTFNSLNNYYLNNREWQIGAIYPQPNNNSHQFYGEIDDIAIWNRALTPQEITALFTASTTNNNETANTTANVPGAISYQAVARDSQGAPLADTNVQVQFTLIADSLSGTEEYVETHTLTTNSLGLFTTAFGGGTPVSNSFDSINWSAGNKLLNVQIDTGNGLVDMGTQQLLSTPYSLHSATSGAIKNPGLPIYSDNAAALAGGLSAGDMYRTGAGVLMVVY